LFIFVGASRGHLSDSTAILLTLTVQNSATVSSRPKVTKEHTGNRTSQLDRYNPRAVPTTGSARARVSVPFDFGRVTFMLSVSGLTLEQSAFRTQEARTQRVLSA